MVSRFGLVWWSIASTDGSAFTNPRTSLDEDQRTLVSRKLKIKKIIKIRSWKCQELTFIWNETIIILRVAAFLDQDINFLTLQLLTYYVIGMSWCLETMLTFDFAWAKCRTLKRGLCYPREWAIVQLLETIQKFVFEICAGVALFSSNSSAFK